MTRIEEKIQKFLFLKSVSSVKSVVENLLIRLIRQIRGAYLFIFLGPIRYLQTELRNPGENPIARSGFAKEGPLDGGSTRRDVVAVIGKMASWIDGRSLAYHTISLYHDRLPLIFLHHPLPPTDGHRQGRIIMNGDEIDKRVWFLHRGIQAGHVDDVIHIYPKPFIFTNHTSHGITVSERSSHCQARNWFAPVTFGDM